MATNSFKLWGKAFKQFPCLLITGPKHPYKTQVCREFAGESVSIINLENPEDRVKAEKSPETILNDRDSLFLIEEIQHSPQIIDVVGRYLRHHPGQTGKFILTSSLSLGTLENVCEKLSGQMAVFPLYPNCWREPSENKNSPFDIKTKNILQKKENEILDILRLGNSLLTDGKKDKFYSNWLQVYMERDLPRIRSIENISDFQFFLKKLTEYNAAPLNMAELARTLNLSLNTVKAWVSVLQDSYIITLIDPSRKDYGLRIKKTPNVYFQDTGLVAYLSELKDQKTLKKSTQLKGLIETFVVNELLRWYGSQGSLPPLYLWSPSTGESPILILETLINMYAFDISLKAKQNMSEFSQYKQLREIFGSSLTIYNIHTETAVQTIDTNIFSLPLSWMAGW